MICHGIRWEFKSLMHPIRSFIFMQWIMQEIWVRKWYLNRSKEKAVLYHCDSGRSAVLSCYHWTISPSGDIALNKLGLSTQVPTVWSYISDGPYREFAWDNIRLKYKHKTNRVISLLSESTILVVEAIRTLGKERIDRFLLSVYPLQPPFAYCSSGKQSPHRDLLRQKWQ